MPFRVTRSPILDIKADAAVIAVENPMVPALGACSEALAQAGGEALREALRQKRFLPVGSAVAVEPGALPYRQVLATCTPRWWNGECNELLVLQRCYESIFSLAETLGCRSLALPFLSAANYGFPQENAVRIARSLSEESELDLCFVAETEELWRLSQKESGKPRILSYVGYYRDYAVFRLEGGLFAFVDLREEKRRVELRLCVEPFYFSGFDPAQPPLPPGELERLREIYESSVL